LKKFFLALGGIGLFFGVLMVVGNFVFIPVRIHGQSMYPAISCGDSIIINGMSSEPELFDVVVFRVTEEINYVKRVIGLPGQHVAYVNDQLYIDGRQVDREYLGQTKERLADNRMWRRPPNSRRFTDDFVLGDICQINDFGDCPVIPEGYFLVLGDNRPNSTDSRHIGLVHKGQLMGVSQMIHWPPSRFGLK